MLQVKLLQLFKAFYLLAILVIFILNTWIFYQYVYRGSTVSYVTTVTEYPEHQLREDTKPFTSQQSTQQPSTSSEHTTNSEVGNLDNHINTQSYSYQKSTQQTTEQKATHFEPSHSKVVTVTSPHDRHPSDSKPPLGHKINNINNPNSSAGQVVSNMPQKQMTGYVVGTSFWDQQTYSVGNILSLQCWAGHHGMVVVEPFMIDSKFGAPLTTKAMKHNDTMMRLGRMYDLDHWNEYSKKKGYAPLVEWKEFLHQAPRSVIIVEFKPLYQKACLLPTMKQEYSRTLAQHGFEIVNDICLKLRSDLKNRLSLDSFTTSVFGNYTPSDVTVVFTEWKGTTVSGLVHLEKTHCAATHFNFDVISPSREVREDVDRYVQRQFGGNDYNTVMVRMEWLVMNIHHNTIGKVASSCLEKTLKRLQLIQNQTLLNSTFVAIDVGRFGSKTCERLKSDAVLKPVQSFFRAVYGNSSSLQQWESTFEMVSTSETPSPGYIGYLQKEIATRAKCILLSGAGTFQRHALSTYIDLHKGTNDACYAVSGVKCQITASKGLVVNID